VVGYFFTPNIVVYLLHLPAKKNILALLYGYYVQQNLPEIFIVYCIVVLLYSTSPSLIYKEEITVGGHGGGRDRRGKGKEEGGGGGGGGGRLVKLPSQVTNKLGLGPAAAKDSDKQAQLQANTMIRPSY
jgi:hypothetical protein